MFGFQMPPLMAHYWIVGRSGEGTQKLFALFNACHRPLLERRLLPWPQEAKRERRTPAAHKCGIPERIGLRLLGLPDQEDASCCRLLEIFGLTN